VTDREGHLVAVEWRADVGVIERTRILRGWTKADLARAAHVDPGTLSDLVKARRRPTLGTMQALCVALGLTLPDVIVFNDVAA